MGFCGRDGVGLGCGCVGFGGRDGIWLGGSGVWLGGSGVWLGGSGVWLGGSDGVWLGGSDGVWLGGRESFDDGFINKTSGMVTHEEIKAVAEIRAPAFRKVRLRIVC